MERRARSRVMSKANSFMSHRPWLGNWKHFLCNAANKSRPGSLYSNWMKPRKKRRASTMARPICRCIAQDKKRLDQTDWSFDQKKQAAPESGLVYDTLFRQGEWVAAGKPVVVLLPPQNIKVRVFIPETRVGAIHYGETAQVKVDGVKEPFVGRVSYISPKAEYTPPVIYSRETRAKLVFMVELIFETRAAADLHPGQPVDVDFKSI